MDSQSRRWRCPSCGREYRIPLAEEDPMVCALCRGEPQADQNLSNRSTEAVAAAGQTAAREIDPELRRPRRRKLVVAATLLAVAAIGAAAFPFLESRSKKSAAEILRTAFSLGNGDEPVRSELFLQPPDVRLNPDKNAPLVALIDLAAREPVVPVVEVDDGRQKWTYRPGAAPRKEHRFLVPGFRPERTHQVRVRVEAADGTAYDLSEPQKLTTPPLPDDFPPLKTTLSRPQKMEPGITLFPVNLWLNDESIMGYGYLIALDARGEVVWYLRTRHRTAEVLVLKNGHLLYNHANYRQIFEVDLLGNVIRQWHGAHLTPAPNVTSIPIEADTLHHELLLLPPENFLTLSTVVRHLDAYPTSETDPRAPWEPANVVGDEILEVAPDGTVLNRWNLFDLLDPYRLGYGSLTGFWNEKYDELGIFNTRDWSHANAIAYDAQSDAIIVSVRHQDCLVKIDRSSGRIIWILGDHTGWGERWQPYLLQPEGDLEWPYHAHGLELTAKGTLLMYDNGNYRACPFDPQVPGAENHSRVVEFQVDEKAMTVRQLWEYRGGPAERFYCPFYCEADTLPKTGNILITDGGHIELSDGTPADDVPSDHQWARILEVTRANPAEKVFEVVIDSGLGSDRGWSVYRSQRIPSLRPLADAVQSE